MASTDSYPDHLEGDYHIPIIANGLVPVGYQPDELRELTEDRIPTHFDFRRTLDADGPVTTITLGLEAPAAGFESKGKEYRLAQTASGIIIVRRAVVAVSVVPEEGSETIELVDSEIFRRDVHGNIRIVSWFDLIGGGANFALTKIYKAKQKLKSETKALA